MQIWRRLRGLLGTTITWGAVGALIGATMFLVRYQPWAVGVQYWGRALRLLGMFLGAGALWGSACGLAFGLVLWAAARRRRFDQLSPRRFMLWGAIAGAAFPLSIYTPLVITRGGPGAIPLFGTLTAISALLGAGFGRVVFAVAKRAPAGAREQVVIGAGSFAGDPDVPVAAREHVR